MAAENPSTLAQELAALPPEIRTPNQLAEVLQLGLRLVQAGQLDAARQCLDLLHAAKLPIPTAKSAEQLAAAIANAEEQPTNQASTEAEDSSGALQLQQVLDSVQAIEVGLSLGLEPSEALSELDEFAKSLRRELARFPENERTQVIQAVSDLRTKLNGLVQAGAEATTTEEANPPQTLQNFIERISALDEQIGLLSADVVLQSLDALVKQALDELTLDQDDRQQLIKAAVTMRDKINQERGASQEIASFEEEKEHLQELTEEYTRKHQEAITQLQETPPKIPDFDPRKPDQNHNDLPAVVVLNQGVAALREQLEKVPPLVRKKQETSVIAPARILLAKLFDLIDSIDDRRMEIWFSSISDSSKLSEFKKLVASSLDMNKSSEGEAEYQERLEEYQEQVGEIQDVLEASISAADQDDSLAFTSEDDTQNFHLQNEFPDRDFTSLQIHILNNLSERHQQLTEFSNELSEKYLLLTSEYPIDPLNLWASFGRNKGLWSKESKGTDEEEIGKLERYLFNMFLDNAVTYLWSNPLDKHQAGNAAFRDFPIPYDAKTIFYRDLIEAHPGSERSKYPARVFKEKLDYVSSLLKNTTEWTDVISSQGDFGVTEKFFKERLPRGHEWQHIAELETQGFRKEKKYNEPEKEPALGDLVLEAVSIYDTWNREHVYATRGEIDAVNNTVDKALQDGLLRIPSPEEMQALVEKKKRERESLRMRRIAVFGVREDVQKINLGEMMQQIQQSSYSDADLENIEGIKEIPSIEVLYMYMYDCNQDYEQFRVKLREYFVSRLVRLTEKSKQSKNGMFPISEFGMENDMISAGREGIVLQLGCRCLGIGEFRPSFKLVHHHNPGILPNDERDKAKVLKELGTVTAPTENGVLEDRALTEQEYYDAFQAGRPADLIGFDMYVSTMGPLTDDNIMTKSEIVATRLWLLALYRQNYMTYPRVGLYIESFGTLRMLIPRPLAYLGIDGKKLSAILEDPQQREAITRSHKWEDIGDQNAGLVKDMFEIYEFAKELYPAIANGIASVLGGNLSDLASVQSTESLITSQTELVFNTEMINKLISFSDQKIGYWLGRLNTTGKYDASGDLVGLRNGCDPKYWREIGSSLNPPVKSGLFSPCDLMFNLHPETEKRIATLIQNAKGGSAKGKIFTNEYRKIVLAMMITESLRRTKKIEISLEDYVTLKFILTGEVDRWAQSKYMLKGKEALTTSEAEAFRFTTEEFNSIIREAGLVLPNSVSAFVSQLGGLKG